MIIIFFFLFLCVTWLYDVVHFVQRERFPYFKANDDRWKNSVRHNLSISPHFRKSVKARTGTGHLWTLALPPSARTIAANLAVNKRTKDSTRDAFCMWINKANNVLSLLLFVAQQKAKENNVQSEEVQDEVARACMELLRAEGSPAVQSTEYEPQQVQTDVNIKWWNRQ